MPALPDDVAARMAPAEAAVRAWRAAHPQATFAEIEATLDTELRAARAHLLADLANHVSPAAPICAQCGTPLRWRGVRTRVLRTDGNTPVPLQRAYAHCPACGSGLFPPGSDA